MTASERRTLTAVAGCLLVASVIRLGWEARRPPPAFPSDTTGIGALVDETREAVADEERRREPLAPGERVDPNRADEVELARLPGVGPALATRLAEAREEAPFRTPADLERVAGVGPATVERMTPHLDLDDPPRPVRDLARGPASPSPGARSPPPVGRLDLNSATAEELAELPGIGPALAARILQLRRERHGFRDPEDLLDVSGIGPATLERLRPLVRVGR